MWPSRMCQEADGPVHQQHVCPRLRAPDLNNWEGQEKFRRSHIMLSEISPSQKGTSRLTSLAGGPTGVRFTETEKKWRGPRARGGGGELVFHADRASVWDNEKVLEMEDGDGGTKMQMHLMTLDTQKWLRWYVSCCMLLTPIF